MSQKSTNDKTKSKVTTAPQAEETQESDPTEFFLADVAARLFMAKCNPPEGGEVKEDARRGRIWA